MKISKEQKARIDNYGESIRTLKDFVESVRTTPGVYLQTNADGWLAMVREIVDNSIDQAMLKDSICNKIDVAVNVQSKEVTVIDNGFGLPYDKMKDILSEQNTSKNYDKVAGCGDYSSGRHGVGAKVVNALSSYFKGESYHYDGTAMRLEFIEGYATTDEPVPIPNDNNEQGTLIKFRINEDIMGHNLIMNKDALLDLCESMLSATPIGTKMTIVYADENGIVSSADLENTEGIVGELKRRCSHPMIEPIYMSRDNGTMKVEIAMTYDTAAMELGQTEPVVDAFCNMCPTYMGKHIDGFYNGLTSWLTKYMNNVYLANSRKKLKIVAADTKCALRAVVFAYHIKPEFVGQQKENVSNPEFVPFIKEVMMDGLEDWSKQKPNDLVKLSQYIEDMGTIRSKSENDTKKVTVKYQSNKLSGGFPTKYAPPGGGKNVKKELLICEGDSAAGAAKQGRDVYSQGVFPIRGKLPNAFSTKRSEFLNNAEVQGIMCIILDRKPYKPDFDPIKDCPFDKIIYLADADVDGGHICCLLLSMFIVYMPQLIWAGKVFKAVPPLYGMAIGREKCSDGSSRVTYRYFTTKRDESLYVQQQFEQKHIFKIDGKQITGELLASFFDSNAFYYNAILAVSQRNFVDPEFIEAVLVLVGVNGINDPASLLNALKDRWRFVEVNPTPYGLSVSNVTTTTGKEYFYLTNEVLDECRTVIDTLKANPSLNFELDGEPASLYKVMKTYYESKPKKLQRFKGLGEMDSEALSESTLNAENRTLIQYTIDDVDATVKELRKLNKDKSLILKQIGLIKPEDLEGL